MAGTYVTRGYGQVEANRLTGITFGNIEAQAPAIDIDTGDDTPIAVLENGMFLCVIANDSVAAPMGRIAVLPGEAPAYSKPYLVYSERKQYDEREGYSDFRMEAAKSVDGFLFPKLVGITPDSCVFTTNNINADTLALKDILYVGDDGYLTNDPDESTNTSYQFVVSKVYTMPDGQAGVKLMAQVREPATP